MRPPNDLVRNAVEEDDEKDSTEEELEKLVFGDSDAFKKNIKQHSMQDAGNNVLYKDDSDTSNNKTENDLELADDADVCLPELHFATQYANPHVNGRSFSMIQVRTNQMHCLIRRFISSLTMIAMIHLHGRIATMSESEYRWYQFQGCANYVRLQMKI